MLLSHSTPGHVRAAALGLAALLHLLLLLVLGIERRVRRESPPRDIIQFVSIWPDMVRPLPPPPEPEAPPPREPVRSPTASITLPAAPATAGPLAAGPPATPSPARPPVDWEREKRLAAERFAATWGRPDTFSPPPKALRTPCVAPEFDEETRKLMAEALPQEPNLQPPELGVGRSRNVQMGGTRVGTIGGTIALGSVPARGDLFDHMDERPASSVPDGTDCD